MNVMPPRGRPSLPCGTYSTWILLNEKLTRSTSSGTPPPWGSTVSTMSDITRPCSMVILRYSSCPFPAFRTVRTAVEIGSFVLSACINAVEALSTRLLTFRSWMVAFPDAAPPPRLALPAMPHDHDRMSISPLCVSSCDSPLITPCMAPLTMRNMSPAPPPAFTGVTSSAFCRCSEASHRRGTTRGPHLDPERCTAPDALVGLAFLVALDVVLEVHACVERSVLLLRLVFEIDFRELYRDVLGGSCPIAGAARGHRGDDHVGHLDDQVLLLALAGLAHGDRRVLDVLTGRARLHQHRRRLVDVVREVEIVEVRLALAAAAAVRHGAALRHAPGPREDLDLALVLVVERFALDVPYLRENV